MRSRNIKPGFFKNEHLATLDPMAQILFIGLWCLADKSGRLEDRPLKIKGEIFPFVQVDVDILLEVLANSPDAFITRYETDGIRVIQVNKFLQHQKPHPKEKESTLPEFVASNLKSREKVLSSQEKVLPSPAESLLLNPERGILNPDSLIPKPVRDEFFELGQQAQDYLAQLNNPSLSNVSWVSGYFVNQYRQILNTSPDIKPENILTCWRSACDVSSERAKGIPYLKAVFEGKLKDPIKPMQAKSPVSLSLRHDPLNRDCQCRDCLQLKEILADCERQQAIEKAQQEVSHGC